MKKVEILAPAGSFGSLKAAINASCDAVYVGGNKFGARAYADNFDKNTMCEAIDYTHVHGKKIYMTINTLLKERELEEELFGYLGLYYEYGIDAVIIQDLGVLKFIHDNFPKLPIHASTQMSLTQSIGADILKSYGVTRLVNARELSLEEIRKMREETDLEIESFVHGALCYCYSGQCLMSSMFGGRSGNRGRCAQPCRMPYNILMDDKKLYPSDRYLLSPKDIATFEIIPDLIEVGIDSFKIEGRMKRAEYAAGVTSIYRKYIDMYYSLGNEKYKEYVIDNKKELESDSKLLGDLYNRGGFTKGYYEIRNGASMLSTNRPNHSGIMVGKVKDVKNGQAIIDLTEDINAQDILEIRDGMVNLYEFTVKNDTKKLSKYTTNFNKGLKIQPGNLVFRTKNNQLLQEIAEKFIAEDKKQPITGILNISINSVMELILECRGIRVKVYGDEVSEALNQPMTKEKIKKQLYKTNETNFQFEKLDINLSGNCFIPVQKLNELRRDGIRVLEEALQNKYHRETLDGTKISSLPYKEKLEEKPSKIKLIAKVSTTEQFMAACESTDISEIYLESDIVPFEELQKLTQLLRDREKKCYIVFPPIFRKATYELFQKNKSMMEDNTINGYIIKNLEELAFVNQLINREEKEVIADANLYVMNKKAGDFFRENKVDRITAPFELNYQELKNLVGTFNDFVVYGHIPLMVTAQCLFKTADGKENNVSFKGGSSSCCLKETKKAELVDRYQKKFHIMRHCRDCYTVLLNSQHLSLLENAEEVKLLNINNIRLDFTYETKEETKKIMEEFSNVYLKGHKPLEEKTDFTRGHFKRSVE